MKGSGMNFASVPFRGFSAAFVLISICACGDGADRNVTAKIGKAAALPCECPPDDPPHVVWQKTNGKHPLVVNTNKKHGKEDNATAPEYRNRTELKLNLKTGDCSLVIHSVLWSDEGLFECYYRTRPLKQDNVYLEVTEDTVQDQSVQNAAVASSSVCGVLVIVIAAAAVFVGITRRNRHQMNGTFFATSTRSV